MPFSVKQTKYAEYFCINISAIQNIAVYLHQKQDRKLVIAKIAIKNG